jgi:acetylcholinesterase
MTDYLVHFVNKLDPNGPLITGETFDWPQYRLDDPQLLTFQDSPLPARALSPDTFRRDAMKFVSELSALTEHV